MKDTIETIGWKTQMHQIFHTCNIPFVQIEYMK